MKLPDNLSIHACEKESIKKIIEELNNYNFSHAKAIAENWTPLDFVLKNEEGAEVGGILGGVGYWGGLEIKTLWIREDYRKKGIGSMLLNYVENQAKEKGAVISMLDTFDFHAEEFYLKNGYEKVGVINDFPEGHRKIYLSKKLI